MGRVLAISSQVVYGSVGLAAAVPALQAHGHDVMALPTVLLSNHPGFGKPVGNATDLGPMITALSALGVLDGLDALLTGYFANTAQIEAAARLIDRHKPAYVLVDPVLGDNGKLYVPEPVAAAIRDLLMPRATCLTPNAFELSWLTGETVADIAAAESAARKLARAEVLATSIPDGDALLATLLIRGSLKTAVLSERLPRVPHGTGDMLAGLYLANRLQRPAPEALQKSMAVLERAIAASAGRPVLAVSTAFGG
jgi:pyridoxine kinase